jgi:hypothetical protein
MTASLMKQGSADLRFKVRGISSIGTEAADLGKQVCATLATLAPNRD